MKKIINRLFSIIIEAVKTTVPALIGMILGSIIIKGLGFGDIDVELILSLYAGVIVLSCIIGAVKYRKKNDE